LLIMWSVSGTGEVRFVFSAIRGGWETETEMKDS